MGSDLAGSFAGNPAFRIACGLLAFLAGVLIASLNYVISRYVLIRHPSKYAFLQVVRQPLQIAYLVALFFLGEKTALHTAWLLIGGCLGVTLPMIWYTYRLVKLNASLKGKGESADG